MKKETLGHGEVQILGSHPGPHGHETTMTRLFAPASQHVQTRCKWPGSSKPFLNREGRGSQNPEIPPPPLPVLWQAHPSSNWRVAASAVSRSHHDHWLLSPPTLLLKGCPALHKGKQSWLRWRYSNGEALTTARGTAFPVPAGWRFASYFLSCLVMDCY